MTRREAENVLATIDAMPKDLPEWGRVDLIVKLHGDNTDLLDSLQEEVEELKKDKEELLASIELMVEAERCKA